MPSPSKLRHEGYKAYDPNTDPMDVQPYKEGSWGYEHFLPDWMEGWANAEADYLRELEEADEPLEWYYVIKDETFDETTVTGYNLLEDAEEAAIHESKINPGAELVVVKEIKTFQDGEEV